MKRAILIGAGLGGLSAAIRLAAAGFAVTVLEQQAEVGGKLQRVREGGYRFDRGPSTITMPQSFGRVFAAAGRRMDDYVKLYRLKDGTRNVFPDGTVVDFAADREAMEAAIAAYSPADAGRYRAFMDESSRLFSLAEKRFFPKLLDGWRDRADPRLLAALLRTRPLTTLDSFLRRYFRHPHTLAMFGRFATYVGSEPRRAPAIFAMLPHLEIERGVYGVEGGTYALADAFRRLAEELGAEIRTNERVHRILVRGGRAAGVETDAGERPADVVIANGDALSVCGELLREKERPAMPDKRIARYEPSLSGFAVLAGVRRRYGLLRHHTVFYPEAYGGEFDAIFRRRMAPENPAIYVCHSGFSEEGLAPPGSSNLFILANAPYASERWDWDAEADAYQRMLFASLERRGLTSLAECCEFARTYTPFDLRDETSAYRGAIYGISSNSRRQTFFRPSNRGPVEGLWFVGGTTHPGGGTPMVALSGQLVAERVIDRYGTGT